LNFSTNYFSSSNSFKSVPGEVPLLEAVAVGVGVEIGHVEGRLVDVAQERIEEVLVANILKTDQWLNTSLNYHYK
jgi:hypothetical protein